MNNPKLIGRTRVNIEFYDIDLSKIDYAKINEVSTQFILDNKINKLPVDVISIANKNSWSIIPYSKMRKDIKSIYEEIIYTDWGFTLSHNNRYFIFYNDNIKIGSQRFTIAHEIGHIVLEHFADSDAEIREVEANWFAANLLMPINVLKCCRVSSPSEISTLCGVGYTSASKIVSRLNDKLTNNINVNKQFYRFIKEYLNKNRF